MRNRLAGSARDRTAGDVVLMCSTEAASVALHPVRRVLGEKRVALCKTEKTFYSFLARVHGAATWRPQDQIGRLILREKIASAVERASTLITLPIRHGTADPVNRLRRQTGLPALPPVPAAIAFQTSVGFATTSAPQRKLAGKRSYEDRLTVPQVTISIQPRSSSH